MLKNRTTQKNCVVSVFLQMAVGLSAFAFIGVKYEEQGGNRAALRRANGGGSEAGEGLINLSPVGRKVQVPQDRGPLKISFC